MRSFKESCLVIAFTLISGSTVLAKEIPKKTLENLNAAYQDEANTANRYQLYAEKAKQEGYPQVEKLFRAVAQSELIHRENHLLAMLSLGKHSQPFELEPVLIRSTRENLKESIKGESKESARAYPTYIQQANKEHADQALQTFSYAWNSEAEHLDLFQKALKQLGHNADEQYYVSKVSGETIAVLRGKSFSKRKNEEYIQIG